MNKIFSFWFILSYLAENLCSKKVLCTQILNNLLWSEFFLFISFLSLFLLLPLQWLSLLGHIPFVFQWTFKSEGLSCILHAIFLFKPLSYLLNRSVILTGTILNYAKSWNDINCVFNKTHIISVGMVSNICILIWYSVNGVYWIYL